MSSRILAPAFAAFALLLSATTLHAQRVWKPIEEALPAAQGSGRLILLDLHVSAAVDSNGDRWIAKAEATPAVARLMDELVLATASRSSGADALPDLAQFRDRKRHLLLLDPWGGVILEIDEAFGDVTTFAAALNALHQQEQTFIRAGAQRREGKPMSSNITWAGGLLDAGYVQEAKEIFEKAVSMAKRDKDLEGLQGAQLGLAAIDLHQTTTVTRAVIVLEDLAAHPANNELGAGAWMLLGQIYRVRRQTAKAIDAFQRAFNLAPKPSSLAEAARRHLDALGSEPQSEVQADVAAGNVHILYPHRDVIVGSVSFGVATSAEATRVELFLDDVRVAELTHRPFRADVSFGPTPHVRTLRAVAWDAKEQQLGEERVMLNDRAVALGVSIVEPHEDRVAERTTVEIAPRVPEGRKLAGVDLYWNETKIAAFTDRPFRHELTLPSPFASGYIRAVARDDSGATAEDVKLLNTAGGSERIGVDAVQVYAIVQERGRYVDGLIASDFLVKEDGKVVSAQVQSGKADPISLGLALDTSGSMQVAMMDVIDYANEFVKDSLGESDKTFVVAFDEQPHLTQPLTSDRVRVTASIEDVRARGGTAIFDAILYALQQFRGVEGKRALVVFTDCNNNAGLATPEGVLQYAREIGVPLYIVEIFTGVREVGRAHLPTRDEANLKRIAEATGGAFFAFVRKVDLPRIFAQIRDDTRGEYLLTYVSPGGKSRDELRKITVEVPGRRVSVRATSGYYPR